MPLRLLIAVLCMGVLAAAEAEVRTLSAAVIEDVRAGRIERALDRVEGGLRGGRIAAAEARDILQLAVATNTLVAATGADAGRAVAQPRPRSTTPPAGDQDAVARAQALLDGEEASAGGEEAAVGPAPAPAEPQQDFIGKVQATQENEAGDTVMVLLDVGQEEGLRIGDRVQIYQNGKPLVEALIKTAEESDSLGLVLPKSLVEGGVQLVLAGDIVKPVE